MKIARNLVIGLGLLLIFYVGAYLCFARKKIIPYYEDDGRPSLTSFQRSDWLKAFVPIAFLDYRLNVERPFRKRNEGHWKSENSDDFVTMARDGKFSFRLGGIEHSGRAEIWFCEDYSSKFTREGEAFEFVFSAKEENGRIVGHARANAMDFSDNSVRIETTLIPTH